MMKQTKRDVLPSSPPSQTTSKVGAALSTIFSDYCRQRRIRFQETSIAEAMSTEIPDTLMCRRGSHLTMKYAEASPITDFKPYLDATGEQMRYLAAEG